MPAPAFTRQLEWCCCCCAPWLMMMMLLVMRNIFIEGRPTTMQTTCWLRWMNGLDQIQSVTDAAVAGLLNTQHYAKIIEVFLTKRVGLPPLPPLLLSGFMIFIYFLFYSCSSDGDCTCNKSMHCPQRAERHEYSFGAMRLARPTATD